MCSSQDDNHDSVVPAKANKVSLIGPAATTRNGSARTGRDFLSLFAFPPTQPGGAAAGTQISKKRG